MPSTDPSIDLTPGNDPIYAIRVAIAESLRACGVREDHKEIVDTAIDLLHPFFRQPLQPRKNEAAK